MCRFAEAIDKGPDQKRIGEGAYQAHGNICSIQIGQH